MGEYAEDDFRDDEEEREHFLGTLRGRPVAPKEPRVAASDPVEILARAIDPRVFAQPRINLFRTDYEAAMSKARSGLQALADAGFAVIEQRPFSHHPTGSK